MLFRSRTLEAVGRLGADEFVVLLRECDLPAAVEVAEGLRAAVAGSPVDGVGTVTKPGLGLAIGGPAINDTPRRMITLSVAEVVDVLARRPGHQHVIITGRDAAPELVEAADLVVEMTKIKHPMDAGRKGQRGIEW